MAGCAPSQWCDGWTIKIKVTFQESPQETEENHDNPSVSIASTLARILIKYLLKVLSPVINIYASRDVQL
jgi:hypothetical protein